MFGGLLLESPRGGDGGGGGGGGGDTSNAAAAATTPPNRVVDKVQVEKEALQHATHIHMMISGAFASQSSSTPPLPLVGAIDQGTSSTRFMLFTKQGQIAAWAQMEHRQIFPTSSRGQGGSGGGADGTTTTTTTTTTVVGWHEHDPFEIWNNVVTCMSAVFQALDECMVGQEDDLDSNIVPPLSGYIIAALGITNQRETTVAWNAITGQCYYNAIVWDDTRTTAVATHLTQNASLVGSTHSLMALASTTTTTVTTIREGGGGSGSTKFTDPKDRLRAKTGLPLASYFAGTKVKWLLDHVEPLQRDMMTQPQNVRFGTIDTWLVYQLTGEPPVVDVDDIDDAGIRSSSSMSSTRKIRNGGNVGGLFLTDVSNASRWLFLDIEKVTWDRALVNAVCSPHQVPLTALPDVRSSSEVYATLSAKSTGLAKLDGVRLSAILGDQQAALFGQAAYEAGEAKNTYGTGMFLMMNTGTTLVPSTHGLLTTIAYQLADGPTVYALEGSVSHSGSTIQWLRDQLEMIDNASQSERLASDHNDGLYLVPAFAGLFAPHWRSDARGCIVGITAAHHKGHIVRAALEAAAYQARELFDAIYADSRVLLKELKVDGGGSHNHLLMQFQADMIRAPVVIPEVQETTAMGAAFAAGLAVGVWNDLNEIRSLCKRARIYVPKMSEEERHKNWVGWKKAVTRSLDWVEIDDDDNDYFLDAETFSQDDDNDDLLMGVGANKAAAKCREKRSAVAWFGSVSSSVFLSLTTVAAIGVGAGFLLGRRRN